MGVAAGDGVAAVFQMQITGDKLRGDAEGAQRLIISIARSRQLPLPSVSNGS
jgi:hypothetical protein